MLCRSVLYAIGLFFLYATCFCGVSVVLEEAFEDRWLYGVFGVIFLIVTVFWAIVIDKAEEDK